MIEAEAQMMQQRATQFLMGDPDEQSSMMADAMMQMQGGMPQEDEMPEDDDGLPPEGIVMEDEEVEEE